MSAEKERLTLIFATRSVLRSTLVDTLGWQSGDPAITVVAGNRDDVCPAILARVENERLPVSGRPAGQCIVEHQHVVALEKVAIQPGDDEMLVLAQALRDAKERWNEHLLLAVVHRREGQTCLFCLLVPHQPGLRARRELDPTYRERTRMRRRNAAVGLDETKRARETSSFRIVRFVAFDRVEGDNEVETTREDRPTTATCSRPRRLPGPRSRYLPTPFQIIQRDTKAGDAQTMKIDKQSTTCIGTPPGTLTNRKAKACPFTLYELHDFTLPFSDLQSFIAAASSPRRAYRTMLFVPADIASRARCGKTSAEMIVREKSRACDGAQPAHAPLLRQLTANLRCTGPPTLHTTRVTGSVSKTAGGKGILVRRSLRY